MTNSLLEKMRRDWDRRARKNAPYYVHTGLWMSPARAAFHRALPVVVALLLFACADVDRWPSAGQSTNPVAPVAARYQGEEAVPNPANPNGWPPVHRQAVPGRAVGLTPVAETFYLGELGDGSALVVQFDGDGELLDLTYTSLRRGR